MMKQIKYILLFFVGVLVLNACEKEEREVDLIKDGKNLVVFQETTKSVTQIADGDEYPIELFLKVTGPNMEKMQSDVSYTIEVDTEATIGDDEVRAVEGTHFRLDETSGTLLKNQDYKGMLNITMLTDGIVTPLAKTPVLYLKVKSASGDESVINSGKALKVVLNFACPSDLAGEYNVTVENNGAVSEWTETITSIGIGEYLTEKVGRWGVLNPDFGFIFTDVCNVITVPQHSLADMYSNSVYSHKPGTVTITETKVTIVIYYTVEPVDKYGEYTATFTRDLTK